MSRGDAYNPIDPSDETPKIFITNLSASVPEDELKKDLEPMFQKFGRIVHLNVKKNKNGLYSFAFLQFQRVDDAMKAISQLDQIEFHGKVMRVYANTQFRRQDRQMDGCFHCKKTGHYARDCPNRDNRDDRGNTYKGGNGYRKKDHREDHHHRHHHRYGRSRSKSRSRGRRRSYSRSRSHSYSPRQRYYGRNVRRHQHRRYSRSRSYSRSHSNGKGRLNIDRYHRDSRRKYRQKNRSPSRSYS